MHRNWLIEKIETYIKNYPEDEAEALRLLQFVKSNENCFERTNLEGHITGSCMLLSPDKKQVLLTHHKKLDMWIQLGGHSDGNPDTLDVSLREAEEESGIAGVKAISEEIFSIDIHSIPARKTEPEHLHYDISFLLQAPHKDFSVSEESHDLKWIDINLVKEQSFENSLQKMLLRLLND